MYGYHVIWIKHFGSCIFNGVYQQGFSTTVLDWCSYTVVPKTIKATNPSSTLTFEKLRSKSMIIFAVTNARSYC